MTGEQNTTSGTNCCTSLVMSAKGEQKASTVSEKEEEYKLITVKDWGYNKNHACGPQNWPVICGGGKKGEFCTLATQLLKQSPVDLQLTGQQIVKLAAKEPLKFVNYEKTITGHMVNTGHSVQFIPEARIDAAEIYGGKLDQHYRFIQYHYHWSQSDEEGSEHTLCGKYFLAELHLVHQGVEDPSKLAVLGIFLQLENKEAKAMEVDAKVLSQIQHFEQKVAVPAQQLQSKLPKNLDSFVRYQGSLTTPPCSENVTWTVFTEPVAVSKEQMTLLRSIKDCNGGIVHKNCRPLQQLNERNLFVCG